MCFVVCIKKGHLNPFPNKIKIPLRLPCNGDKLPFLTCPCFKFARQQIIVDGSNVVKKPKVFVSFHKIAANSRIDKYYRVK